MLKPIDWLTYVETLHDERAGVSERVLQRALSGSHTPYRWLARAVSSRAMDVLDVACGSGAMSRELERGGRRVTSLDYRTSELRLARERGVARLVCGDARRLPFADESFDAVTTAMGLAVIQPTSTLVGEMARVLRPGGSLAVMTPAMWPMNAHDLATVTRLASILRTNPRVSASVELTGIALALGAHDLRKVEDARERYHVEVTDEADARLVLSALYLPTTSPHRVEAAVAWLVAHAPVRLPVPIRRIVAIK